RGRAGGLTAARPRPTCFAAAPARRGGVAFRGHPRRRRTLRRSRMLRLRPFLLPVLAVTLFAGSASAATKLLARIAPMQPANWDSPLVPRVASGSLPAAALTTAPVLTPTSPAWLNWAVSTNAAVSGTWIDQLELDGVPVQLLPRRKQAFASQ